MLCWTQTERAIHSTLTVLFYEVVTWNAFHVYLSILNQTLFHFVRSGGFCVLLSVRVVFLLMCVCVADCPQLRLVAHVFSYISGVSLLPLWCFLLISRFRFYNSKFPLRWCSQLFSLCYWFSSCSLVFSVYLFICFIFFLHSVVTFGYC